MYCIPNTKGADWWSKAIVDCQDSPRSWWTLVQALEVTCLLPFNCRLRASLSSFSCSELKRGISANTYVLVALLDLENPVGVCMQLSRDGCKLWAWPGTLQSFKTLLKTMLRLMTLDVQVTYSVLKVSLLYKIQKNEQCKNEQCELGFFWLASLIHCCILKSSRKFWLFGFFFRLKI